MSGHKQTHRQRHGGIVVIVGHEDALTGGARNNAIWIVKADGSELRNVTETIDRSFIDVGMSDLATGGKGLRLYRDGQARGRPDFPSEPESRDWCDGPASYLAYSTARVSRITTTLIWPGYWSSASMRRAISSVSDVMRTSSTSSGVTIIRISRPAWIAYTFSTPR